MDNLEIQIIRKEVEEKLKDLARQVGLKLGEQEAVIGKIVEAFQGLSVSLAKVEEQLASLDNKPTEVLNPRDGKEL